MSSVSICPLTLEGWHKRLHKKGMEISANNERVAMASVLVNTRNAGKSRKISADIPNNICWTKSFAKSLVHDDIIKWKHFPRYWPFVRGIDRSPVNSPHKDQWRGALMFSLICAWINGWVNNGEASDLRHHRVHYEVTVMGRVNYMGNMCSFSVRNILAGYRCN